VLVGLCVGGIAAATSVVAWHRPALAEGRFSAVAAADGMRVQQGIRHLLIVEQIVDAGMPAAQAGLDSTGASQGFAAAPYPGDLFLNGPGLVNSQLPPGTPQIPDPPYPLMATSSYPDHPDARAGQPTYTLHTTSSAGQTTSSASFGPSRGDPAVGSARASTEVSRAENGLLKAVADTAAGVIGVNGTLVIGTVTSHAEAVLGPDGARSRSSGLDVNAVTIGGQAVSITDKGISAPGSSSPLPNSDPLMQLLARAGISVKYLVASQDATGVIAPGLEIDLTRDIPNAGQWYVGYIFGRASAHAEAGADLSLAPPISSAASGLGTSGAAATGTPGARTNDLGSGPMLTAPTLAVSPSASPMTPTARPRTVPNGARKVLATSKSAGAWLYLTLAVAAIAITGSAQLLRVMGVRVTWMS
jgi:hypothetical protein